MPRRSPAAVRAALPRRAPESTAVDGLSAATMREIRRCERARLRPGAVARALAGWRQTVYGPLRALSLLPAGCPCCDATEHRAVLEQALAGLTGEARRQLAVQVAALDEVLRDRTHHDPQTRADDPWWRRRA